MLWHLLNHHPAVVPDLLIEIHLTCKGQCLKTDDQSNGKCQKLGSSGVIRRPHERTYEVLRQTLGLIAYIGRTVLKTSNLAKQDAEELILDINRLLSFKQA
jgi:hypothetical protein